MMSAHRRSVVSKNFRGRGGRFDFEGEGEGLQLRWLAVRKHYDHERHLGREFDPVLWQEPVRNSRGPECRRCSFDSDDEASH